MGARDWLRLLGGPPSFFFWDGATHPECGLDGIYDGNTTLRECTSTSLESFLNLGAWQPRRIIIVSDIGKVPPEATLLAVLLGARVQDCVYTPGLRFCPLVRHTFATTKTFRLQFKKATSCIQAFCLLPRSPAAYLQQTDLNKEVHRLGPSARPWTQRTLFVTDSDGAGEANPPKHHRTLEAFISEFGKQAPCSEA